MKTRKLPRRLTGKVLSRKAPTVRMYLDCKRCKGWGALDHFGRAPRSGGHCEEACAVCEGTGKVDGWVSLAKAERLTFAAERQW